MKKIVFINLLVFTCLFTKAQDITIIEDPVISNLVTEFVNQKKKNPSFNGFRIQLYSSSDYENAKRIRFEFSQEFPDTEAYLEYQQPNYKVRVGDFRTRLEAEKFKERVSNQYSSNFIVPDKILFPKL